ncbi:MAG: 50S ribosome-binding GTPase [Chthonomonadales bacterium]|nr:50S ribosome-binding GTPase [Chthonomonadales bacterium]
MRARVGQALAGGLRGSRRAGTDTVEPEGPPARRVTIVGNPNVGKSVVFNRLTGRYVVVSNYPGTTVEVSRGRMAVGGTVYEVVDTPGMYSLQPLSEEERVGRALLMREPSDVVVHVIDAKNLDRMLPLTLQLLEAGLRTVLALNMMDEAERHGLGVDTERLSKALEVPVVATVALTGKGIQELKDVIHRHARAGSVVPRSL